MKKVAIIMGSDSDLPVVRKAADTLQSFGVPYEMHVYSAHRTPVQARDFALNARENGFGTAISFVLILVVVRLVLILIFALANKLFDIGALKALNKILGCIVCVCLAICVAWGSILVVDYAVGLPQFAENEIVNNFTGGFVYRLFKQYNPIELLF